MVSTRHHPREFPPPATPNSNAVVKSTPSPTTSGSGRSKWVHTPSAAVTIWLVFSIPLIFWDAGYVLLRPHSMPGGKLHSPIWTPYALYGTIDYIYGWPAFNARNGFTAAQTVMNLVETAGYLYYLFVVYRYGTIVTSSGRASRKQQKGLIWFLKEDKSIAGRTGAIALLVAFSASVMTVSKTALYWLNEVFSGFENIGHNSIGTLIVYWIVPNGLWLIFPSYNIYILGAEIINSLETATARGRGRAKST
ncbi:hypothetical protein DTO271G3_1912 [Paecilomyces variotii]|nr:hypothetical protein DTO271G3_1912 [Paecilomyces variotii]